MNKKWLFTLILMGILALWISPSSLVLSSAPSAFTSTDYQLPGGIVDKSSPTLANVTGDSTPEILIGTTNENYATTAAYDQPTMLVVMNGQGQTIWSRDVGAPINSSPTVGDINNDGEPEVVVSFGGSVLSPAQPGGVIAYDSNGNQLWRFTMLDHYPVDGVADGVFGSPTLCDVDNDNDMEIAIGGWDQRIYLLDHQGNSLWNNIPGNYQGQGYLNADSIWSTAACVDLNGDNSKEIIIGADITGGGILPDNTPTENGGFLYILDKDGNVLVRRFLPETVYSSPAVGDLDGNGTPEIVVGTGYYWWQLGSAAASSPHVYAFDTSQVFGGLAYNDENKLPNLSGWPIQTEYPGFSSPALADLDGNNDLEIIIGTGHPTLANDNIPGAGRVYAWHHTGEVVSGWPINPTNANGDDTAIFSSPTVADVDNDGSLEVLFSMIWDVHVYNSDGSFQERLPTQWTIWGSPAVGDTDGDNQVDVWIGGGKQAAAGGDQSKGYLWNFEQTITGVGEMPWPQFHRDAQNSGYYSVPQSAQPQIPTEVSILHQTGSNESATGTLQLSNSGGVSFNFEIRNLPNGVQVSSSSGQVPAGGSLSLLLTVNNTQNLGDGQNQLGTFDVYDTDTNSVAGQVSVIVVVGDLSYIYLPMTKR